MSSKPWYAWYPGDYAADTRNLSPLEHGCYRQLLDSYYAMAEALPEALPQLYRICGAVEEHEKAAVQAVLNQFFTLQNNKFHNKRADDEIRKQAHIRETLSERGKAGATARWDGRSNATATNSGIAQAMADGMAYPQPHTTTTTTTTEKTNTARKRPNGQTTLPADFAISEQVRQWAKARGFSQLDRHFESFTMYAESKGATYKNWDMALMRAIREDWARLRPNGKDPKTLEQILDERKP